MGSGSALSAKSTAGSFLIAPDTLATVLTACALSVTCGDTSPKGRGKSTAGNFATPETTPSVIACGDATFPKGTADPLRRSRARFPLLSPTVTSSLGAGEVFPQRESQGLRLVAKVLGIMGKFAAAPKGAPLGELAANVVSRLRGFLLQN